ncbi:MAG: hypothetical protein U1F77_12960 [Kiritimatiellia bacterium]
MLELPRLASRVTAVYELGDPDKKPRPYHADEDTLSITLPLELPDADATVYVVETDGPAVFTPEHVIRPDEKGVFILARADLDPQLGVSGADYYSQKVTTVVLQGHLETAAAGTYTLELTGDSATPGRPYRLRVGGAAVSGPLPLRGESLSLPAGLSALVVERADPVHMAEDLGLPSLRITLTPQPGTP